MHAASHHSTSPPARPLGPTTLLIGLRGGVEEAALRCRPRVTDPLALGPSRCASSSSASTMPVSHHADTYRAPRGLLCCTYGVRAPASCVPHVPEAQGGLPRRAATVRASCAYQGLGLGRPCVPRAQAPPGVYVRTRPPVRTLTRLTVAPQARRRSCTSCRWGRS